MSSNILVTAFCRDTAYDFVRDTRHSFSYFGGPSTVDIKGVRYGAKPLHHIATLSPGCIPDLNASALLSGLPLIYGMCYSGCQLRYKQVTSSQVKLLAINPAKSSKDWPYRDYPTMLPYLPLKMLKHRSIRYKKWSDAVPNLSSSQPADLIVAVPPPADIGVTLWGGYDDAAEITIVFECDLESWEVNAYNVCT